MKTQVGARIIVLGMQGRIKSHLRVFQGLLHPFARGLGRFGFVVQYQAGTMGTAVDAVDTAHQVDAAQWTLERDLGLVKHHTPSRMLFAPRQIALAHGAPGRRKG